jgi:hypothetical protein
MIDAASTYFISLRMPTLESTIKSVYTLHVFQRADWRQWFDGMRIGDIFAFSEVQRSSLQLHSVLEN